MSQNVKEVAGALDLIHTTLRPLLFRDQDLASLSDARLLKMKLPKVAANTCKLASLITQAFWCLEKVNSTGDYLSEEIDDQLKHLWKGGHKHDAGFAISLLTKVATTAPQTSYFSKFVGDTDVLHKWNRLFASKLYAYRNYAAELLSENWPFQFRRLVQELPVLRLTAYMDGRFVFIDKHTPEYPLVRSTSDSDQVLYLHSFERVDSSPRLVYESPFNNSTFRMTVDEDENWQDYYKMLRQKIGLDELTEGVIHLFGNGYLYLENLAKTIAHTPGKQSEAAYKWLEAEYADKFRWSRDIDIKQSKADFAVMLLAAEGPSLILKDLLGNSSFHVFNDYLAYLEPRVEGSKASWLAMLDKQTAERAAQLSGYLGIDKNKKKEILQTIELETRCWCLLKAAGFEVDKPKPYVETIDMRIDLLTNWKQMFMYDQLELHEVGRKTVSLVERTFKFLICFYAGLEGYLEARKQGRANHAEQERAMLAAARRKMKSTWRATPGILLREKLFREDVPGSDEITEFTDMAQESDENDDGVAYPLLGRKQICDTDLFPNIASKEYVDTFNRLKHDLLYDDPDRVEDRKEVDKNEMEAFLDRTISLFEFLRTGNDKTAGEYTLEPVYPMIISFQEEHRNRDGLMIYDYEIYSLNRKDAPKIRILTPYEYAPNQEYYCIPFCNRSTRKWWLDPFLIPCSQLDTVLLGGKETNTPDSDRF
jgi:hypothetical protein